MGACGAASYNYGYSDPQSAFRSIMAYDCALYQCNNLVKAGCPRVQRFSNPNYGYNGAAIGDAANDNARQLNEKRAIVASFYQAMNCQSDSACNDNDSTTVDTCNLAINTCVFTPVV